MHRYYNNRYVYTNTNTNTNCTKSNIETIVIIRHAEKPELGLGQLSCKGLNRSLLLPDYFKNNHKKADYIFAPNPSKKHYENHGDRQYHYYIRPLATIEPTAIQLGLPVNIDHGARETRNLVNHLLSNQYHDSVIYVAWEHSDILHITKDLLKRFNKSNTKIPDWTNDNYDTVFVFEIDWNTNQLSFSVKHQRLGNISGICNYGSQNYITNHTISENTDTSKDITNSEEVVSNQKTNSGQINSHRRNCGGIY